MKKYAFYITNHGFGHASRNIPLIEGILEREPESVIYIKTDTARVEFMSRNLTRYTGQIYYDSGYCDVGLILKQDSYEVDAEKLERLVRTELDQWKERIEAEEKFLTRNQVDVVISDILPWVLPAAKNCGIRTVLLCNFTWYEMYRDFLPEELCLPYKKAYQCADQILVYEFGSSKIEECYANTQRVSLISRKTDEKNAAAIRDKYPHPIVFVSVGKSIEMRETYDVSQAPGTYLITAGVGLEGENVVRLPDDLICTQDYIKACDYAMIKGGWSTMAEVLLNQTKAGVMIRGSNSEDFAVSRKIKELGCMVEIRFEELGQMEKVLKRLDEIDSKAFQHFRDEREKIVTILCGKAARE